MMPPNAPPPQLPPRDKPPPFGKAPPSSGLSIVAFILAMLGFVAGLIPFVGYIGTIGFIIAIVDWTRRKTEPEPQSHGFSQAAMFFGVVGTIAAVIWTVIFVEMAEHPAPQGSCPHLYAFNGETYQLDSDLVSGALYKGAEREDVDRLESIREQNGKYRVRLQNDLQEIDRIDSLALLVVDAPSDVDVLPTQSGELVAVHDRIAPLSTLRANGASKEGDPRETWTFEFARPQTDRALLVIRGRNTAFAEAAFVKYMATMGTGVRPLLEWRGEKQCACFHEYMTEEIDRLGLPIWITASHGGAARIDPIGPAILRNQAVPIELPAFRDAPERVTIALETTPRFWEIESVELAPFDDVTLVPRVIEPRSAVTESGADVLALLTSNDGERASIKPGNTIDVELDAPAAAIPGTKRTVLARLRGYYDLDIGGHDGVNVALLVAHRVGWTSLPRYAATLASN